MMRARSLWIVSLLSVILLAVSIVPSQAAITYGRWRNINATQYSDNPSDPAGSLRAVFVRSGGFGAIGAGDGWAVGGSIVNPAHLFPLILHYDGFSWHPTASPNSTAEYYNSANFCTAPGAPGVGLCSPNGDGSDGWIVGYGANGGIALYWDGSALTSSARVPDANNLTSVFLESHNVLPSTQGVAVAVGQNITHNTAGTGGAIWQISGTPYGQLLGGWSEQPLSPLSAKTTRYNSVYMYNTGSSVSGFAVGNGGVIAQLGPGGWVATQTPTTNDLLSVFVDQSNPVDAWAVGRAGTICRFGTGTSFLWVCQSIPGVTADLYSIFLVSSNEAWIVGTASTIIHFTNLPTLTSPSVIVAPTGAGVSLFGLSFPSSGNGWAVGSSGVILQTGISTCPGVSSPCWGGSTSITQSISLNGTYELGSSDAWAGGAFDPSNPAFATTLIHWDGSRWSRPTVSLSGQWDVASIYMTSSSDGWAVGSNDNGAGHALDTTPLALHWDGNTWTPGTVTGCATCGLRSVYMLNSADGWAVGTGGNIFHFVGSMTWSVFFTLLSGNTLRGVFINNPGSNVPPAGWAVGDGGAVVQFQVTSGPTYLWSSVGPLNGVTANLYGVYFKDSQHGWIVGQDATILTTSNDGQSWSGGQYQVVGAPAGTILRAVFVDTLGSGSGNGDGWAVGDDGSGNTIMAHWDGATWSVVPLSPPPASTAITLNSVSLTGPEDGFAVGSNVASMTGSLSAILHLDPLSPPIVGQQVTTTTTSSSSVATSSISTSIASSTSSSASTQSVTTTSSLTATTTSTAVSTTTLVVTPTTSSSTTETITTPEALPAIPGFPWESIIAGLVLGMAALAIVRRRRT